MLPGPILIIACRKCGAKVRQMSLLSGNTFGAKYWSDGYREAPMLPEYPLITKCPGCKAIYWLDKGKRVGEMDPFSSDPKIPFAEKLSVDDLLSFLKLKKQNKDDETYLRRQLWWELNHSIRKKPGSEFPTTQRTQLMENLERLIPLLNPEDEDQAILKLEALRELGRFEEMDRLRVFVMQEYEWPAEQIFDHAERGDAKVFELEDDSRVFRHRLSVAGVGYYDYAEEKAQKNLRKGDILTLRPEPHNPHDKKAVEVLTPEGKKIGYVPKPQNEKVAELLHSNVELKATIESVYMELPLYDRVGIRIQYGH